MSNFIVNRVSFISCLVTFIGVLVFSTFAQAQYSSSSNIIRSNGSGGHVNGNRGFNNRGFNAQRPGNGFGNRNNGLRLKTHGYQDASRSGARLGNSGYYKRDFVSRTLRRNNQDFSHNQNLDNRRILRVNDKRIPKNEGYSYGTNPRNNRNVRRTNQFNSDSDLYYVDQFGYSVLSSNNGVENGYYEGGRNGSYDDDFRQVVVVQGDGETPTCPEGMNCGYRLYEDGTGPRIIAVGDQIEGLPPQDGLTGGPKVITLGE